MAFTHVATYGVIANKVSDYFINITGIDAAVGDLLVLAITFDYVAADTTAYVVLSNGQAGTQRLASKHDGIELTVFTALVTTAMTGGTATFSFLDALANDAYIDAKAAVVSRFTRNTAITPTFTDASTTGAGSPSAVTRTPAAGDLLLGFAAFESSSTPTGDTDTLEGSWSTAATGATAGGASDTNVSLAYQYKIATGTSQQSWAVTGVSADHIATLVGASEATTATHSRSATDPLGLADSRVGEHTVDYDPLGLIDEVTASLTSGGTAHSATFTDPLGALDAISGVGNYTPSFTSNLGLLDAATQEAAYAVAFTDTLGLTDNVTSTATLTATHTDLESLLDAIVQTGVHARAPPDELVGLLDSRAVDGAFERTQTDALGLLDSVAAVLTATSTVTDVIGLGDTTSQGATDVLDTFTRADSTTAPGTSDSGHLWNVRKGTWGIASNQAYKTTTAGNDRMTVDAGRSEAEVRCIFRGTPDTTTGQAIVARQPSGATLSDYVGLYAYSNQVLLYRSKSGVGNATLASTTAHAMADGDVFGLICEGDRYRATRNGVVILDVTDTTTLTGTHFGIEGDGANTSLRWDDFQVRAPGGFDVAHARTATDPLGLLDTVAVEFVAASVLTDLLGVTDDAAAELSPGDQAHTRSVTDDLGLSDEAPQASYGPAATDNLGATDTAETVAVTSRDVIDALGPTDVATQQASFSPFVTEPVGITDAADQGTGTSYEISVGGFVLVASF